MVIADKNKKRQLMKKDKRGKGGLWIREIAAGVSFYRVNYGEKKERVITVPYNEVMKRKSEVRALFTTEEAAEKLDKYFRDFPFLHREMPEKKKNLLTAKQILESMQLIEESLAQFVEADPKCQKPENRQLGCEVWRCWGKIRPHINTVNGWNIRESDSKKALGWGSQAAKEDDTNA